MSFDLNEWFKNNPVKPMRFVRESIVCKDGFRMSVQASEYHYCNPRESGEPYYYEVEIGFPSEEEPSILVYAENPEEPTDTVYGYVPTELVEHIVMKHGGLKENV